MPSATLIGALIGVDACISRAGAFADKMIAMCASEARRTIMPIVKEQPRALADETIELAVDIPTIARIGFHGCSHSLRE
jgi:hypothetical protein